MNQRRGSPHRHNHAGLIVRGVAWLIDSIALLLLSLVMIVVLIALIPPLSPDTSQPMMSLVYFILSLVYYIGFESRGGQTPGKSMLGIKVVEIGGNDCGMAGAVIRNITKILGGGAVLPILVAIILILATDDNQRLGDILGETTVVRA